jgi:hypothetical protein
MHEFYGIAAPAATATDSTGIVFFTGVPAGTVHLTATPGSLQKASSMVTINVRAGYITGVTMFPTPAAP